MKKVLQGLFGIAALLIVAFVVAGLIIPSDYHVERTININANTTTVHRLISDLEQWPQWQPWEDHDPSVKTIQGSQTTGVGANQSWTDSHGGGAIVFTRVDSNGIDYDVNFDDGAWTSRATIALEDSHNNNNTKVVWSFTGNADMPVLGSYFAISMDSMVGPMFEHGLKKLKAVAESQE